MEERDRERLRKNEREGEQSVREVEGERGNKHVWSLFMFMFF